MPLIFILLRRSLYIVQQAHTVTLHMGELAVIQYSLMILTDAIWDRVQTLKAVHKLQNLDDKEQMKKFFFGLYSFAFEEPEISDYWKRDPDDDANMVNDLPSIPPAPTSDGDSESQQGDLPLFHGPTTEDIDLIVDPTFDDPTSPHPTVAHSLVGHWSGSYAYDDRDGDGLVSFTVSSHDVNGAIVGSGTDAFGPYVVHGTLDDNRLTFVKEYLLPQYGQKVMWRYEGVVSPDSDSIRGQWGPTDVDWKLVVYGEEPEQETGAKEEASDVSAQQPKAEETTTPAAEVPEIRVDEAEDAHSGEDANEDHDDDGASDAGTAVSGMTVGYIHGTFFLTRRPVEYLISCPPDEEFAANRPRALWKLALNATLRAVQSRTLSWGLLSARRKQRQQYVELLKRRQRGPWRGQDVEDAQEWAQLIKGIHPGDLHLWRCIALYQLRRDVIHDTIYCDACRKSPITPTRFTCMNCSEDAVDNSMDLCIQCFSANRHVTRDKKVHHPTHNVIQYRTMKWRVYRHPTFSVGRDMLKWAEDQLQLSQARSAVQTTVGDTAGSSGLHCVVCKTSITAPPYWCCLTCNEDSAVCYACNERMEREKEWLYLRGTFAPNGTGPHNWSHTLISAPGPEVITAETDQEKAGTIEERIARVEAKLDASNLKLDARLAALEDLLRAVLAR
ncbi:hypothetical protein L226DRAFT_268418 [Lentinus tigrinus ALCF2SS1-7]|uniref:uncharacterized protein n=1 Tax=Lentinus tigrinus ALCF2SS1-7 TaxID=1328758 RepID=UPI001166293B|nr:hypothetical protein L226DRAFT_268418 [Lentinus tigrinus ALCF2SS1-7]